MLNPYHPLNPPDDPTQFFGREDAIAFVRQRLVGAHHQELLMILGREGIGKTSLLHHIPYIIDERYQTVLVPLGAVQNVRQVITAIVHHIVTRMEVIGASTYRVPEIPAPETPLADLLAWFADDFLGIVLTAIRRDRYLLLLLDDFHHIFDGVQSGSLPADFINYLGGLLKQHERFDIMTTLNVQHEDRALRYSATANVNLHFRLLHLGEAAARQLIVEPIADEYTFDEEVIERVLKLAGGYPFLLHSVCRLLYRHREGNKQIHHLGMHALDAVYQAALEETGEVMQPLWLQASPEEQAVLLTLAKLHGGELRLETLQNALQRSGTSLNHTQLASILRTLEYNHVIKTSSDGLYSFQTELEAKWLLYNEPTHARAGGFFNSARLIGLVGVVLVIVIIGAVLALGLLEGDGVAEPNDDAPPTLTLDANQTATPAE